MRLVVNALVATLAMGAVATPAAAQSASDGADVRCLLTLQVVARDPKQQESAVRGIFYYLGKLSARGGLTRLEPMMLAEGKAIQSVEKVKSELARCGAELNKQSTGLQATNERLQKAARASAPAAK